MIDTQQALHKALGDNIEMAAYYGVPLDKVAYNPLGAFE